jgi:hypothetical protein
VAEAEKGVTERPTPAHPLSTGRVEVAVKWSDQGRTERGRDTYITNIRAQFSGRGGYRFLGVVAANLYIKEATLPAHEGRVFSRLMTSRNRKRWQAMG